MSVSVGNSHPEDQMMHTFLDSFHQGGKYSAQIASHQAELRREEKFTYQKYLSISYLNNDYLNLDSISGFGINSERANTVHTKCTFCGGTNHSTEKYFKSIRQEKGKACTSGHSDNRRTEQIPLKYFRCGSQDHLISKFPKPPKDNDKHKK